ncbi:SusE domain-containing protein [Robertkochia solimangrovi]|uniref:SusE domain-containing protein n=1 Tax=Robertkochia solimangrovi TaxID=2213046 RepID=UPI001180F6D7|nr:SusE domain-containing protein [Robertkochia solimangrovi]TRZ44288.1 hypothetical protein DMZ48_07170 [Robertkochia solimangrovi]
MKKIVLTLSIIITTLSLGSCDKNESLEFTAQPDPEGVQFSNSFSSEYLLSEESGTNLAERFFWNEVDFDAPVNISYDLEASLDAAFETVELLGTTNETNLAVTIDQLIDMAEDLGLDDDPNTTDENGLANDTGVIYFRLHAYAGTGAANTVEVYSEVQPLTVRFVEKSDPGAGCPSIYGLGDALTDAQWNWNTRIEFSCDGEVYTGRATMGSGNFRFFETEGDWASGLGYSYFTEEGFTIDANLADSGDGDSNFTFTGTPGIYEIIIDNTNKTITLNESTPIYAVGDAVPGSWTFEGAVTLTEISPYIYAANLDFNSGIFRFFTINGDWGSDLKYSYFDDEGYTIDSRLASAEDNDGNFTFAGDAGNYTMTINMIEKTLTLE